MKFFLGWRRKVFVLYLTSPESTLSNDVKISRFYKRLPWKKSISSYFWTASREFSKSRMISFFIIKISTFYNPGESRNVFEKKGVRKKIFENFFEKKFFFCLFKNAKKEFFYCFLERNLLAELCKQRKTEKLKKEKKNWLLLFHKTIKTALRKSAGKSN